MRKERKSIEHLELPREALSKKGCSNGRHQEEAAGDGGYFRLCECCGREQDVASVSLAGRVSPSIPQPRSVCRPDAGRDRHSRADGDGAARRVHAAARLFFPFGGLAVLPCGSPPTPFFS